MRCVLVLCAVLWCVPVLAAKPDRQVVAAAEARVDEANRLARIKAAQENTPLIHGWAVKVDEKGRPRQVPRTWPNPSYRQ